MPLARYNAAYGGQAGSARKAKRAMEAEYGTAKGERVFYATAAKRGKTASTGRTRR